MSWKPVTVELEGGDTHDEKNNHYDSDKLSRKAKYDLPVNPGEDVGIFYGLEVCHDYGISDGKLNSETEKKSSEVVDSLKRKRNDSQSSAKKTKEEPASKDETKAKKKKKKRKQVETSLSLQPNEDCMKNEADVEQPIDQKRFRELQQAWCSALEPELVESLYRQNFFQPTPIQAETLNAAILGRRNIVGAAPTGSGKTLAFILPILNYILQEKQATASPQAVIVTPTRELATQIQEECNKLMPSKCVTLVGGIALVKQARLLQTKRPPVIIGTPGRLWAMVRTVSLFESTEAIRSTKKSRICADTR
eukprot:scaffold818_cov136-Cylindrotheca_fusiformis.AAC.37